MYKLWIHGSGWWKVLQVFINIFIFVTLLLIVYFIILLIYQLIIFGDDARFMGR